MNDHGQFDEAFRALTDCTPFPWQKSLYEKWFGNGKIPRTCDLPTGLGKTSVLAVWLIALARGARLPRRLVYVVNRRTVVDQTTTEVERLRERLRTNLERLDASRIDDLGISTLRGQYADNREWSADPSKAAVICGTVDMIGSRLLFSGYRIGYRSRPLHAGFLGQDALLVHDEAHLEPAFQRLVDAIQEEQRGEQKKRTNNCDVPWPRLHVMAMSATGRNDSNEASIENDLVELTPEEKTPPEELPDPPSEPIHHVWRRLKAKKKLCLDSCADDKAVPARIAEIAESYDAQDAAVLVFVRKLEHVETIEKALKKAKRRVKLLTGTMRGRERDGLVRDPVFVRFLPPSDRPKDVTPAEGTVYLVCTSAGEVGVNLSADHMVCDLSTFESMAQRFGRVNRFGDREDTCITVVAPESFDDKDSLAPARQATLKLLEELSGDASPSALGRLDPTARRDAFAPEPSIPCATDILFDAWSLTSIRQPMPGRPPVEPYLHGIAEWQPPETHVAWREEVERMAGHLLDRYPPADLLDDYPLKPHELLRDRSDRVFKELQTLAKWHPDKPVWIVEERGTVEVTTLGELTTSDVRRKDRINGCTILLAPKAGGLSRGMLDGKSDVADDVADIERSEAGARLRIYSDDSEYDVKTSGMRRVRSIEIRSSEDEDADPVYWDWFEERPLEGGRTANKPVDYDTHVGDVERRARGIVERLELPGDLAGAVVLAAKLHDLGKRRERFQATLGNRDPSIVLAKSGRRGARLPETFRHEFASLFDAREDPQFAALSPEMQDVVLHLIASHHGRARPHFDVDEGFDPERSVSETEAMAVETPRRFARLQRRYGWWGLAYLESLLRAADWAASAEPSAYVEHTEANV